MRRQGLFLISSKNSNPYNNLNMIFCYLYFNPSYLIMIKKRLTKKEIDYIKQLIESGSSLNEIVKITGKSKTTIYYHFRNIKGKTYSSITINEKDHEHIGEFIGLFAGDGNFFKTNQYHYRVFIFFGPDELYRVTTTKEMLIKLFSKSPIEAKRKNSTLR